MRCVGIYPLGTLVLLESGDLAVVTEAHESYLLTPTVNVFYSAKDNAYIRRQKLDLSRPAGLGGGDWTLSHESPQKWNMDPMQFLGLT